MYSLPVAVEAASSVSTKHAPVRQFRGRRLFDEKTSLSKMLSLLAKGAEVKTTTLTDAFTFEDYLERQDGARVMLVAWDEKQRLQPFRAGREWTPGAGWTVASLVLAEGAGEDGTDSPPL